MVILDYYNIILTLVLQNDLSIDVLSKNGSVVLKCNTVSVAREVGVMKFGLVLGTCVSLGLLISIVSV